MMTVLKEWVLALGGAGLLCGLAQCLIPSKAMEKQLKLVLSLVLLCLFFGIFGKLSLDGVDAFSLEEQQVVSAAGGEVTQAGVLMLTRLELAQLVEQTLTQQTGLSFSVAAIELSKQGEEVAVSEITLHSFHGMTSQEIAQILSRQLALSAMISEVKKT